VKRALLIRVAFPRHAYSGGEFGDPEPVPSPARLHAAFVSAAAGGPSAELDGKLLRARGDDERALRWMEENEPLAVLVPDHRVNAYSARRYRLRAAVDQNDETDFEPLCALAGAVAYAWPPADEKVVDALARLAREVTHVGRAESTAIVHVEPAEFPADASDWLLRSPGRGPGYALRVPAPGRVDRLVAEHRRLSRPGRHTPGSTGKQAKDVVPDSTAEVGTVLRRFATQDPETRWPFAEVLQVPLSGGLPAWFTHPERRVATAVRFHRAIVAAIGNDVPSFVTGRDGDGPRAGAGHLAIHFARRGPEEPQMLLLAVPSRVPEADLARLLAAISTRRSVRIGQHQVTMRTPRSLPALPFWRGAHERMTTEVPLVLDAPGVPRHGRWTLDDAVVCSIGYALRGVLEDEGMRWGTGWAFRRDLVASLRERGVEAVARRVLGSASRFAHRARPGDLLVAVHATVSLGDFAGGGSGLLALGRARHLGGGMLRPASREAT